jgi:ABC-type transporter Mla MlaB component
LEVEVGDSPLLRITNMLSDEGQKVKVEGRLTGEFVEELSRVARRALADSSRVVLEMADVSFVDQRGLALLRSLQADGVELAHCSQFVRTLMNGERGGRE